MAHKHTLTQHHRQPESKKGGDKSTGGRDNISLIEKQYHDAWHLLFGNEHPHEIAKIANKYYLHPDYEFVARKKPPVP